ncbi:glycoside hydrolase family 5 protein [Patulibacter sp. NPDC049589]|uniref:glycoside hydrolase family 5 protein n=1 Tax=Patulibacter sp. NPDC049589 TaxID=3154731 RepID=UPI003449B679
MEPPGDPARRTPRALLGMAVVLLALLMSAPGPAAAAGPEPQATFTAPEDGATGVSPTTSLTWNTIPEAQNVFITIGTSTGANDVLASGELPGDSTSYEIPVALPRGVPLHVRIYTKVAGAYDRYEDITFTAEPFPSGSLPAPHAEGTRIVAGGRTLKLRGVNRDSLTWGRHNWSGCGGDQHFTDRDFDEMQAWGFNAVRIPLSQANWLGRRCDAGDDARMVDSAVQKANERGMYAIVDLHWSDVGGRSPCDADCNTGQQPMPDADSLDFWRQVAQRYEDRSGVIFDLYNEPHDVSWSCWRDGGCTTESSEYANGGKQVDYRVVGLQQLADAVRGEGAGNLVLAAGLDWAWDLRGVVDGHALDDPNVAYDTHVYTLFHHTQDDWDEHVGVAADEVPVTATEFGSSDCSTADTRRLLDWFDDEGIGWSIWSWNDPGSCQQPSVLANMEGTPLAGQGQLIHDRLAAEGR